VVHDIFPEKSFSRSAINNLPSGIADMLFNDRNIFIGTGKTKEPGENTILTPG
jgi:hypothetical protein